MAHNLSKSELIKNITWGISSLTRSRSTQAIAFYDLVGSTSTRLHAGHEKGFEESMKAALLFRKVVTNHGGHVVKEMGDGVLARFTDPLVAAFASLDIISLSLDLGVRVKAAVTFGLVDLLQTKSGDADVIGNTVDRCARIQSYCLPNQVLVDKAYLETVQSFLASHKNILVGNSKIRNLKGIGNTELFEISYSTLGLKKYIYTDFRIHEKGRIPLNDKVNFVKDAESHVIEIGVGLRTFSNFFSGQRPAEFQNYIENLVVRGVNVTILALDPEWEGATAYLQDRSEQDYKQDIIRSLTDLKEEQRRLLSLGVGGAFEIRLYQTYPFAHILCVDPEDQLSGRMFVSYYLPKLKRSECPVLECSSLSNREFFEKHKKVLLDIINFKSILA